MEGGTDRGRGKGEGREGVGGAEECASTTSPLRKILEERTTREIPTRNHISAKHIDLIYKTSTLM